MSGQDWQQILQQVTAIAGVRGALIVSVEDGLVIAESAMEVLNTADVAALASALVTRAARAANAMQSAPPSSVHLSADQGVLLAVAGPPPLWLVAVADPGAELGRLRLLLGDYAGTLA